VTREAVRAATLGLRGVAFAIWLAPLAALAARAAYGLEGLVPWRNWLCALPLSTTYIWICPLSPSSIASRPPGVLDVSEVVLALLLAFLAGLAYLRPLASMAWLLGLGWGAMGFVLHIAILLIEPGRRDGDPIPPWMGNSLLLALVLVTGALAIHAGRRLGQPWPERG